jgi:type I restriction enzyme M protein
MIRKFKQKRLVEGEVSAEVKAPEKDQIIDFATGKLLWDTPEEHVRQTFERRLVEEYGYSKDQIDINFMIQKGSLKIGPADIVVFKDDRKIFDNIYIIVETKRRDRKDGEEQLKTYLNPTPGEGGVWFNGNEIVYLRVIRKPPSYTPDFIPWRNIPKKEQSWEEIGKHKTASDLIPTPNLKSIFKIIYYHLYANSNLPRAERLAAEMTRLIFCKIHDEIHNGNDLQFRAGADEPDEIVAHRIKKLFEKVIDEYSDVFGIDEKMLLDETSIAYVAGQLQDISLLRTDFDAVGEAFEVFIGPGLRGEKGQFFTPRNVVRMCVEMLDPEPEERIIDPACGSGGFLIVALEYVWKKIEERYKYLPRDKIISMKSEIANKNFCGIDKEFDLAKVSKAYMAIVGDGRGGIFCADSLVHPKDWTSYMQEKIKLGTFDILLTNPPFGAKIPITSKTLLQQYNLGFRWKRDKKTGKWFRTNEVLNEQVPQVLFIERCLQLLRPGGRMAIVLPDGILGNPTNGYIRTFIRQEAKLLAVVGLPVETFMPSVGTKTSILFLQKKKPQETEQDYSIFMAVAEKCGHDRRGNEIYKVNEKGQKVINDDLPDVVAAFKKFKEENNVRF